MALTIPAAPGAARPLPDAAQADPVLAGQHVFRVVLDALANPGTVRRTVVHPGVAGVDGLANPWLASVLLTLLDHEVSLHVAPGPDAPALADLAVRRVRTPLAPIADATFVVADATRADADLPERLTRGSLEYPDDGATLLLDVPSLDQDAPGDLTLTLGGPGIPGERTLRLTGVAPDLIASRDRTVAHYPMGIDLLLIDRAGRIAGLPRTTVATVAEGES